MEDERIERILDAMSEGTSLRAACREEGVTHSWFLRRVKANEHGLRNRYAAAREAQAHALADTVIDIATEAGQGSVDPHTLRVRLDAAKWAASKILPKQYGDKVDVTVDADVKVAGYIIDLTAAVPPPDGMALPGDGQPSLPGPGD
ncbi:hypothetical protein M2352_000345 [Azospirillum fermentarium]|uniref:terminase small subunit-like protein n=1 Tax=Azospirillum fermentarium TaxID=1233114 RepID=UPI0022279FFC|nr:hypothetical protein [Azospirillum fermentarium]MCW2244754.1 hypothetical protein [Azospirillum fermentarium]